MSSNDACTATGVQEPLDERFVNTSYVAQVFSWINVLVLLYVVVVLYFGRFAYSAPFMLHDMRNKEKMKEARAILREKRKRAKQQRKQSERGIGESRRPARDAAGRMARTRTICGREILFSASPPRLAPWAAAVARRTAPHSRRPVDHPTTGDGGADTELTAAPRPPPATEDVYAGTTAEASMEAASASGVNLRLAHGETSDGGPGAATAAAAPAPAARAPRPSSGPRRVSVGGAEVRVEDLQLEAFVSLERQLVENDNPAVALSYTGFMAAFCLILTGPRTPPLPVEDGEEWLVLSDILLWSAIGLVLLAASAIITDRIVLYKLFARGSLLRGNVVTGANLPAAAIHTCASRRRHPPVPPLSPSREQALLKAAAL